MVNNITALDAADNRRFDQKTKLAHPGYAEGVPGIIDTSSAKEVAKVEPPKHPESFQLEKDGPRIFVNLADAKQVAVIDHDERTIVDAWPMKKFQAYIPIAINILRSDINPDPTRGRSLARGGHKARSMHESDGAGACGGVLPGRPYGAISLGGAPCSAVRKALPKSALFLSFCTWCEASSWA